MIMKLRSKRLIQLWDCTTNPSFTKKKRKPVDGSFIYSSLFSVVAYSTQKEITLVTKLAKEMTERLGDMTREKRDHIKNVHERFLSDIDTTELNPFRAAPYVELEIQHKKMTPVNALLIKIFVACDDYFLSLQKARRNGEISEKEQQEKRVEMLRYLERYMSEINERCIRFHKVRKEARNMK
ncbi:DUF1845 domain-containing protein [Vibrio nigripulchritudo]|uniref:DUF1845 domain-containing protein n=1 Tax=Vibrio nigripulchritudo TaxID=28173 RepID=UPI0011AEBB17|nr:DUF1845 domain-containing protein [Vibrio nigripulchritudo]